MVSNDILKLIEAIGDAEDNTWSLEPEHEEMRSRAQAFKPPDAVWSHYPIILRILPMSLLHRANAIPTPLRMHAHRPHPLDP